MENANQPITPDATPTPPPPASSENRKWVMWVSPVIVILTIISGVTYFFANQTLKPTPSPSPSEVSTKEDSPTTMPDDTVSTEPIRSAYWKTYINNDLKISLQYPPNLHFYQDGWETAPPQWSLKLGYLPKEVVRQIRYPDEQDIFENQLPSLGQYNIWVIITYDTVYRPRYGKPIQLTADNLNNLYSGLDPKELKHFTVQNRSAVGREGKGRSKSGEIGASSEYYIFDGNRLIRLYGSTSNIQKVPHSYINQILSTFTFD